MTYRRLSCTVARISALPGIAVVPGGVRGGLTLLAAISP